MKIIRFPFYYLIIGVAAVLLGSCTTMLYTSIDVLRPASVTFPVEVEDVVIVNNTLPQPHEMGHITELFGEHPKKHIIDTDSLPLFHLAALAQAMTGKEFFKTVKVDTQSSNKGELFFSPTPPSESTINILRNRHKTNAIISLNRIMVNDHVAEMYNQESGTFTAYIEAKYEMQWSIHFTELNKTYPLVIRDTVYWESESQVRLQALKGLPNRRDALIDGALITGERSLNRFIPYWEKEDRYFFNSNNDLMKAGIDSVYVRNWNGAIDQWNELLVKSKNNMLKAKTAFNIAVAYEIQGEYEKALSFADEANENMMNVAMLDVNSFVTINQYYEKLRTRVEEMRQVRKQLGE